VHKQAAVFLPAIRIGGGNKQEKVIVIDDAEKALPRGLRAKSLDRRLELGKLKGCSTWIHSAMRLTVPIIGIGPFRVYPKPL
jgi:hypothetical protein